MRSRTWISAGTVVGVGLQAGQGVALSVAVGVALGAAVVVAVGLGVFVALWVTLALTVLGAALMYVVIGLLP